MLGYFFASAHVEQVLAVAHLINQKKKRLEKGDYTDAFGEYERSQHLFNEILEEAKRKDDEYLANSQYVAQQYFLLFCNMGAYFKMLQNREYKNSWSKLQDCFDIAVNIGRYTETKNRLEIPELLHLFAGYESLYPYSIFSSSEFVISKSHCSICGKSMQNLECPHIKGNLYWGEVAVEIVSEIKTFQAVCIVSHPQDKRCILELSDDTRSEQEKFTKLDQFLNLGLPFLQRFSFATKIEQRMRDDVIIVGRNQLCSCGSGLKFKRCCGKNLYYEHERNIVQPQNIIKLVEIL